MKTILSHLPTKCNFQGFDVADITGDSLPEIVVSYREPDKDPRRTTLLLFIGQKGGCLFVREFIRHFRSTPVEVGYALDDGLCVISEKRGEDHWRLSGYALRNGLCYLRMEWENGPAGSGSLRSVFREIDGRPDLGSVKERYIREDGGRVVMQTEYREVHGYPASLSVPRIFRDVEADSSGTMIVAGSSSWSGVDDCSFSVMATYTDQDLRLTVHLHDDRILTMDEKHGGDSLMIFLDLSGSPRLTTGQGKPMPRIGEPKSLFRLILGFLRNGAVEPFVIEPSQLASQLQPAISRIHASRRSLSDGSEEITVVFPRGLIPLTGQEVGLCAVYRDVDYPERPEWVSVVATADAWPRLEAGRYGALRVVRSLHDIFDYVNYGARPLLGMMRSAGLLR